MGAAMAEKVVGQQWRWRRSDSDGGAATAMAVQQRLRRRSNGLGGTATAMAAQRQLRWRSDSNGDGNAAMGVAVVVAVQRWRRSNRATLHFFVEFMICVRSLRQTLLFSEV